MATERSVSRSWDFVFGIAQSVVAIGLGITGLRVVPQFVRAFKDFGAKLPDMTILVISLWRFLGFYWYLLVLPILLWPFVNWGIVSVLSPRPEVVMAKRIWYCVTWGVMLLIVVFTVIALCVPLIGDIQGLSPPPVAPIAPK